MAYCSPIILQLGSSNVCGLAAATSTACSLRSCTDSGIGAIDDPTCAAYKSGCKFARDGYCYLPNADCTAYVIPIAYANNYLLKTKYCANIRANSRNCTYRPGTSTTNCSIYEALCDGITIGASSELVNDADKIAYCTASKNDSGGICFLKALTKCD